MDMHFVFRTDASKIIGTGHVMRCLTLAGVLADNGAHILFICREHDDSLCSLIQERGFAVKRLPVSQEICPAEDGPAHAGWLGAEWENDAEQTIAVLEEMSINPEWLIVDHYALDHRWEGRVRPFVKNIFVIDDIADRNHDCDLLLDQNLITDSGNRYYGRVSEKCRLLLGPEYALLQPIYTELHERVNPRAGPVRRILIFFGGTDTDNLTGRTLYAFISLNRQDIEVDVIISDNNPFKSQIEDLARKNSNIHIHSNLPTLAPLMAKADLAVGAAGTTSWERLSLGLFSIVITLANNQTSIAEELQKQGFIYWLGNKRDVSDDKIRKSLARYTGASLNLEKSIECKEKVDGKGALRVAAIMTTNRDSLLKIRRAEISDEKIIFRWINDPETRKNSFSTGYISPGVHHNWFDLKLRDLDGCCYFIFETKDGIPVGQVRFEKKEGFWEVSYLVAPEFRNRGLGKKILNSALLQMHNEYPGAVIIGKVKGKNLASRKIFESLDFEMSFKEGEVIYKYSD